MDEETWDDPGVAAVVERLTVPVRVDADERPDVYGRYHLGGLPSTAVLDADGEFVRGGTFLAPTQLLGLLETAEADLRAGRRPARRARPAPAGVASLVEDVLAQLRQRADREHGGFGAAPKHPEPDAVTLLLRQARRARDGALAADARESLDAITLHLVDPADGAFFRYAAGPDWSGPHTGEGGGGSGRALSPCSWRRRMRSTCPYRDIALRARPRARGGGRARPEPGRASRPPRARRRMIAASPTRARRGAAGLLAFAQTDDPGFALEAPALAPDGVVPHRLDAPPDAETPRGLLRDQALSIAAAVDAYRLGGERTLLDWALRAAAWSHAHLWEEGRTAFRDAPLAAAPAFTPLVANGEMAQALLALADHTGEETWRRVAAAVVDALGPEAARSPAGAPLALAAQRLASTPVIADLAGAPGEAPAGALARAVVAARGPQAVVRWRASTAAPSVSVRIGDRVVSALAEPSEVREVLGYTDQQ
jgi:uncharacterized protein YyaL (SSP411 family)